MQTAVCISRGVDDYSKEILVVNYTTICPSRLYLYIVSKRSTFHDSVYVLLRFIPFIIRPISMSVKCCFLIWALKLVGF